MSMAGKQRKERLPRCARNDNIFRAALAMTQQERLLRGLAMTRKERLLRRLAMTVKEARDVAISPVLT